jgi:hypothetical protein
MEFSGFYLGGRTDERILPLALLENRRLRVLLAEGGGILPRTDHGAAEKIARHLEFMGVDRVGCPGPEDPSRSPGEARGDPPEDTLDAIRPDVVHCNEFTEFTAQMALAAKARDIPLIVTVRDFWFRCPRGNLLRSDGTYCGDVRPPGLGCAACMTDQPEFIFLLSLVDRALKVPASLSRGERARLVLSRVGEVLSRGRPLGAISHFHLRPQAMKESLEAADYIITPSFFVRSKCLELGMEARKVVCIGDGGEATWWPPLREAMARDGYGGGALPDEASQEVSTERCARELVIKYRQAAARGVRGARSTWDATPNTADR